jgi:hypothetical protein
MNEALYLRNPEQSELGKNHYAQHCNDPRKWFEALTFKKTGERYRN